MFAKQSSLSFNIVGGGKTKTRGSRSNHGWKQSQNRRSPKTIGEYNDVSILLHYFWR